MRKEPKYTQTESEDDSGQQSGISSMSKFGCGKGRLDRLLRNVLAGKSGAKEQLYAFLMENRFNLSLIKPAINRLLELQSTNNYAKAFNQLVEYKADFNLRHLFLLAETKMTTKTNEAKITTEKPEPLPAFNPNPLRTRLTPNGTDFDEPN